MKKVIFGLGFIIGTIAAFAQPGKLDSSFGNNGIVITEEPGGGIYFNSFVVLNSDKILVQADLIKGNNSNGSYPVLIRYLPDGKVDSSFGVNGFAIGDPEFNSSRFVVQPDGKIVLTGYVPYEGKPNRALSRFLPDGRIDSGFGTNGLLIHVSDTSITLGDIEVLPDGKLISIAYYLYNDEMGIIYPALRRFPGNHP